MLRCGRRRRVGRGSGDRQAASSSAGRSVSEICGKQSQSSVRDEIDPRADNGAEGSFLASMESQGMKVD